MRPDWSATNRCVPRSPEMSRDEPRCGAPILAERVLEHSGGRRLFSGVCAQVRRILGELQQHGDVYDAAYVGRLG